MVGRSDAADFEYWRHPVDDAPIKELWQVGLLFVGLKVILPSQKYISFLADRAYKQGNQRIDFRLTFPTWRGKQVIAEILQVD